MKVVQYVHYVHPMREDIQQTKTHLRNHNIPMVDTPVPSKYSLESYMTDDDNIYASDNAATPGNVLPERSNNT